MDSSAPPCNGLVPVPRLEDLVERDKGHDCSGFGPAHICVRVDAVAELPTRFGRFRIVAFWNNRDGKEHVALVHGDVMGHEDVPTRLHSECLTADALQDRGLDTVEANRALGFRDDERDYGVAAHMIASLNVKSVRLMTNNPNKIQQLEKNGIRVTGRIPHVMPVNEFNRFYLETKAVRSGHYLEVEGKEVLIEQDDPPVVEAGRVT